MVVLNDSPTPYFYLHLPIIHDLGVLMPFMSCETEFLASTNVAPSHVMFNVQGIVKAFKIIHWRLGVFLTIRVFLSFYGIKVNAKSG